jgi:hypothetical protein
MSSSYNPIEERIAFFLSRFPKIKLFIKKSYQKLNSFLYKKSYKYKSIYKINELNPLNEESFFGYYDKSPMNASNSHLIFQSSSYSTKKRASPNQKIQLILLEIKSNDYIIIDDLLAYNWQQGSKLMWINDAEFIYNNYDVNNDIYISKIYNINKKTSKTIKSPIYDATDKFGITLNFERLKIGRGDYAYSNKKSQINWDDNSNDGLFFVDLLKNSIKLIVSLQDVIKKNEKDTMGNAKHKFNHIMLSPNKDKIMFMHRWFTKNNTRYDTLYVSSIDGANIEKVADDDMVSHCYWYNNDTVLAYLRDEQQGDKYYKINIHSKRKEVLGKGVIDRFGDGHPSVFKNKILFDTYPNKSRMKELYLFNMETSKLLKLGEFYESFKFYGETRCDLHPRFSKDGNNIFVDSVHTGKRRLYWFNIKE